MSEATDPGAAGDALARLRTACCALERQNSLLKQLVTIYARLTGLVLQGGDLAGLTRVFASLIGRAVTVLDPMLQPLAAAGPGATADGREARPAALRWTPGDPHLGRVLATLAEERRPLRIPPVPGWEIGAGCVLAPILVGGEILAYLAIVEPAGGGDEELDLLTVEHAATVYALALMRQHIAAEIANRLKEDLIEGLLLGQIGDEQQVRERALLLGYDSKRTYRVLSLVPEGPAATGGAGDEAPAALALRRRVLDAIVDWVADHVAAGQASGTIAVARKGETVILGPERLPGEERRAGAADLGRALSRHLQNSFPAVAVTIGIGGLCRNATELPRSYTQARRAVETAQRFGRRGEVIAFEDLGIYRLLFQVNDPAELRDYADRVLGALVAYDRKHQADFVRTLAAYLRHHGSLQDTARELIVHVNTVNYRLERVQTITGLDLEDADDRLAAQVALKILELPESAG